MLLAFTYVLDGINQIADYKVLEPGSGTGSGTTGEIVPSKNSTEVSSINTSRPQTEHLSSN